MKYFWITFQVGDDIVSDIGGAQTCGIQVVMLSLNKSRLFWFVKHITFAFKYFFLAIQFFWWNLVCFDKIRNLFLAENHIFLWSKFVFLKSCNFAQILLLQIKLRNLFSVLKHIGFENVLKKTSFFKVTNIFFRNTPV